MGTRCRHSSQQSQTAADLPACGLVQATGKPSMRTGLTLDQIDAEADTIVRTMGSPSGAGQRGSATAAHSTGNTWLRI